MDLAEIWYTCSLRKYFWWFFFSFWKILIFGSWGPVFCSKTDQKPTVERTNIVGFGWNSIKLFFRQIREGKSLQSFLKNVFKLIKVQDLQSFLKNVFKLIMFQDLQGFLKNVFKLIKVQDLQGFVKNVFNLSKVCKVFSKMFLI